MGVEAHRLLYHPEGVFWTAREVQHIRLHCIAVSIIRIEGDGPFAFGYGLVILLFLGIDRTQERMGSRQRVVQSEGLLRQRQRALQGLGILLQRKSHSW